MVNELIPATPFTPADDPVRGTKRTLEISGGRELYIYEFEITDADNNAQGRREQAPGGPDRTPKE